MHNQQLIQTKDNMTQPERLISALLPENMRIDDRGLEDLLQFLHQLAGQITYYNAEGRPAGDWATFLESDQSILIAILSKLDISGIVKQYEKINFQITEAGGEKVMNVLRLQLDSLFNELKSRLQVFQLNVSKMPDRSGIVGELSLTLDAYMDSLDEITSLIPAIEPGGAGIDRQFSGIKAKHAYLQSVAGDYLLAHPILEQEQSPHIGLLLTFLHLYAHLQEDMNGLTRKHLDLYYRQILNIDPQPAIADEVLVFFEPDPSMKTVFRLPAGTELLAAISGT
jgi:hypothetical protein